MLFTTLSLFVGLIFIISQFYTLPIKNSYHGVICDVDKDLSKVIVQYEKKGEKRKATFCYTSSSDLFYMDFQPPKYDPS